MNARPQLAPEINAVAPYLAQYGALKARLPGAGLPWLTGLREAGLGHFSDRGFPTLKQEDWKYTNLNALKKLEVEAPAAGGEATAVNALPRLLSTEPGARLVFVNGCFDPAASDFGSLPPGAELMSLGLALDDGDEWLPEALGRPSKSNGHPLLALNAALMADGYVLRLGPGDVLARPIEIVYLARPGDRTLAYHPRNLILAEAGSQATIVEHHLGLDDGTYFTNGVTELRLERDAQIRLFKLQDEASKAFHLHQTSARIGAGASLEGFTLSLGGRLVRNEIKLSLDGRGAACRLNGAYALGLEQHCDNTSVIDHIGLETTSRQVYKGVLDDRARAVFQGRIAVRPGAQGTDGHQLNKTLLLSDQAEIDTKPELEINADDVKCSHGATAGELEEDALFYLRSRGIPEDEARDVLVQAFLDEALEEISDDDVRQAFQVRLADWRDHETRGRTP